MSKVSELGNLSKTLQGALQEISEIDLDVLLSRLDYYTDNIKSIKVSDSADEETREEIEKIRDKLVSFTARIENLARKYNDNAGMLWNAIYNAKDLIDQISAYNRVNKGVFADGGGLDVDVYGPYEDDGYEEWLEAQHAYEEWEKSKEAEKAFDDWVREQKRLNGKAYREWLNDEEAQKEYYKWLDEQDKLSRESYEEWAKEHASKKGKGRFTDAVEQEYDPLTGLDYYEFSEDDLYNSRFDENKDPDRFKKGDEAYQALHDDIKKRISTICRYIKRDIVDDYLKEFEKYLADYKTFEEFARDINKDDMHEDIVGWLFDTYQFTHDPKYARKTSKGGARYEADDIAETIVNSHEYKNMLDDALKEFWDKNKK